MPRSTQVYKLEQCGKLALDTVSMIKNVVRSIRQLPAEVCPFRVNHGDSRNLSTLGVPPSRPSTPNQSRWLSLGASHIVCVCLHSTSFAIFQIVGNLVVRSTGQFLHQARPSRFPAQFLLRYPEQLRLPAR